MTRKILYLAATVVIAIALLIATLEILSSYPTQAIVYNTKAPVQSIKTITIHANPEKVWTILSEVNKWEAWERDNKKPVLNGDFKAGNFIYLEIKTPTDSCHFYFKQFAERLRMFKT